MTSCTLSGSTIQRGSPPPAPSQLPLPLRGRDCRRTGCCRARRVGLARRRDRRERTCFDGDWAFVGYSVAMRPHPCTRRSPANARRAITPPLSRPTTPKLVNTSSSTTRRNTSACVVAGVDGSGEARVSRSGDVDDVAGDVRAKEFSGPAPDRSMDRMGSHPYRRPTKTTQKRGRSRHRHGGRTTPAPPAPRPCSR